MEACVSNFAHRYFPATQPLDTTHQIYGAAEHVIDRMQYCETYLFLFIAKPLSESWLMARW